MIGQGASSADLRPYHQVVSDAVAETNRRLGLEASGLQVEARDVHRHLLEAAIGLRYIHVDAPAPERLKEIIPLMFLVYRAGDRRWVRAEMMECLGGHAGPSAQQGQGFLGGPRRARTIVIDRGQWTISIDGREEAFRTPRQRDVFLAFTFYVEAKGEPISAAKLKRISAGKLNFSKPSRTFKKHLPESLRHYLGSTRGRGPSGYYVYPPIEPPVIL